MYQLLDDAQREVVADVVNAALLASASGKPKWEAKPQVSYCLIRKTLNKHNSKIDNGGNGNNNAGVPSQCSVPVRHVITQKAHGRRYFTSVYRPVHEAEVLRTCQRFHSLKAVCLCLCCM